MVIAAAVIGGSMLGVFMLLCMACHILGGGK
jgi:hypothetical protein